MYLMTSHRYYSREASTSFSTFRTQLKSTQLIKKVSQQLPETVVTTVITYFEHGTEVAGCYGVQRGDQLPGVSGGGGEGGQR